ncbi:MAG TPA: DNA methyltransferase [Spirochaetaceae bacterium]|nr:DNA methyltransferase [Spirochaetaceae bacterium]
MTETSQRLIAAIKAIATGSINSYGRIAAAIGLPNGARQVARLLHSCSTEQGLPWWRVVKADGCIALPPGGGLEIQRGLLEQEGWTVSPTGRVSKPGH